MKKIIRLQESDLIRIVKKVLREAPEASMMSVPQDYRIMVAPGMNKLVPYLIKKGTPVKWNGTEARIVCYPGPMMRRGLNGDSPQVPVDTKFDTTKPEEIIFKCQREIVVANVGGNYNNGEGTEQSQDRDKLYQFLNNYYCKSTPTVPKTGIKMVPKI